MTDPILDNRSRVVAGKAVHARRCDRCGTFADTTITWAMPLEEGGQRSDWNTNCLCGACRADRAEEALTNVSKIHMPSAPVARAGDVRSPTGRVGFAVEVAGQRFASQAKAAKFWRVSETTMGRWIKEGVYGAARL